MGRVAANAATVPSASPTATSRIPCATTRPSGNRHAGHVVDTAVEHNGLPGDRRVAPKPPLPETVRQQNDSTLPGTLFAGAEATAECGSDAQHVEQVRRDLRGAEALRIAGHS